jgi:hypothetical protein
LPHHPTLQQQIILITSASTPDPADAAATFFFSFPSNIRVSITTTTTTTTTTSQPVLWPGVLLSRHVEDVLRCARGCEGVEVRSLERMTGRDITTALALKIFICAHPLLKFEVFGTIVRLMVASVYHWGTDACA